MVAVLFALLLTGKMAAGFGTHQNLQSTRPICMCRQRCHPSASSIQFNMGHSNKEKTCWQLGQSSEDDDSGYANAEDADTVGESPGPGSSQPSISNAAPSSPFFTPTPIELPIDGSLVVLLPAAVIAIFGIITSAMVFASSGDPILAPQDAGVSLIDNSKVDPSESHQCRGLGCGRSQESDLNRMRDFMSRFANDQPRRDEDVPTLVAPSSSASSVEI
jgi:hypothetical protein